MKINTIILAGGKATRLNGISKGLILYHSKPIIEHLINITYPFSDKIIISANNDAYHYLNLPIVKDIYPDIGPMGGIYSCLLFSDNEKNLVLACDLPYIKKTVIEKLYKEKNKGDIIIPVLNQNNTQPLCAIYSKNILPIIQNQIQKKDLKLKNLLSLCKTHYIRFSDKEKFLFTNINYPEDIKKLNEC